MKETDSLEKRDDRQQLRQLRKPDSRGDGGDRSTELPGGTTTGHAR